MTVYNGNIPQPNDRPSDSQSDLLNNFSALKVFVDRNHVAIVDPTTNTSEGKHKFLQIPEQSGPPTTAVNEGGLYVKEQSSRATLFYRQESDGTEIQLTNLDPSLGTNGYTFLPGGLILQWGQANISTNPTAVTFPTVFTAVYQVTAVLSNTSAALANRRYNISSQSNTGFSFWTENVAANLRVRWMAIGSKT